MGNSRKGKKHARKLFNRAGGKHNKQLKISNTKAIYRQERKIEQYRRETIKNQPYQIVHRQYIKNGKVCVKFAVRRIPLVRDKKTNFLRLGKTSLKFVLKQNKSDITGNRIINLEKLKEHVVAITTHTALCLKAQDLAKNGDNCLTLNTETTRQGLYSVLSATCKGCGEQFIFETSEYDNTTQTADINLRAVWGCISTGQVCSSLQELLGTMNMPSVKQSSFSKLEEQIGKWWEGIFKEDIIKAIERGDFDDGVPCITVLCDGGWSKRAHKHSYNASGGCAVIFGAATKKLLYLGVRNKYCYLCNNGKSEKEHICYKNWNESSQSMESDMILEGFLEAESVHGLRYTKLIADGDSSVYSKIVENVPVWGPRVKKLECANHACKCLRSNLEKLVQEKPEYKGKGKLTKALRIRLTTAVRCAIRMRSKENNKKQLKKDIKNSVYHVFGFHDNCSDFCKKRTYTEKVDDVPNNDEIDDENVDDVNEFFEDQACYWDEKNDEELNESRFANIKTTENVLTLIRDVSVLLNRLAEKSDRLIGNFTTNLSESWMNIRCKFDGSKVHNRCNRGSWQTRCVGGALRKNLGPAWSPIAYQKVTENRPGLYFLETFHLKSKHHITSLKTQRQEKAKTQRRKRKQKANTQPNKKAKLDYGPSVLNDTKDVSEERLKNVCLQFYSKIVEKKAEDIGFIERGTKEQHLSKKWVRERKIRLTSSNFGKVYKRQNSNVKKAIVKNMLYSNFKGNFYTIRGLAQESNTLIEYRNIKKEVKEIQKMGLMVCEEKPFLAASTDGKVIEKKGDVGLIEIKNVLQNNKISFNEASEKKYGFCLRKDNDGKLHLKENHEYYYQCQGQLNIFKYKWLDFVVRRTDPHEIHIESIKVDNELWKSMIPKLEAFYNKFLLPELALPRHGTVTGIREPKSPWYEDESLTQPDQLNRPKPVITGNRKKNVKVNASKVERQSCVSQASTSKEAAIQIPMSTTRQRRKIMTKFVGRRISKDCCINESTGESKWFRGTVLGVKEGRDGQRSTVYEILYDGEDSSREARNLQKDLDSSSLTFIDV